jgi:DNA-binding NtrC family response regulator
MNYKLPTIMLCESYPGLQEAFQLMLEGWALLRPTPSVNECLVALTQDAPDLLILDIDDQKDDPLALVAHLRGAYPHLKVLLVAAQFAYDFQVACVKLGQFSFLTKPFSAPAAVAKMKALLGLATPSIHTRVVKIALS